MFGELISFGFPAEGGDGLHSFLEKRFLLEQQQEEEVRAANKKEVAGRKRTRRRRERGRRREKESESVRERESVSVSECRWIAVGLERDSSETSVRTVGWLVGNRNRPLRWRRRKKQEKLGIQEEDGSVTCVCVFECEFVRA